MTNHDQPDQARDYWEHFHHVADIGVRGVGITKARAFEQAALAMMAVIVNLADVRQEEEVAISCQAVDDEFLLNDWLNALVAEMDIRKMVFSRFTVSIEAGRLTGRAWGERIDVGRHAPAVEVKGATLTSLRVGTTEDGRWLAQCVVDV